MRDIIPTWLVDVPVADAPPVPRPRRLTRTVEFRGGPCNTLRLPVWLEAGSLPEWVVRYAEPATRLSDVHPGMSPAGRTAHRFLYRLGLRRPRGGAEGPAWWVYAYVGPDRGQ